MIITEKIKYRGKLVRVKDLKPQSEMKVEVECPVCYQRRWALYKSIKDNQICHKCANSRKRKDLSIGNKYNRLTVIMPYEAGRSLCVCDCGSVLVVDNYFLVSGHTKSCGCLQKELAGSIIGEYISRNKGNKHPNWKGGISSKRRRFNASKEAKQWRKSVFERDNYTCQRCSNIGGRLNAHHIKQFATHPKLRLDIDNGITLCESCHRKEHKKIGKNKLT